MAREVADLDEVPTPARARTVAVPASYPVPAGGTIKARAEAEAQSAMAQTRAELRTLRNVLLTYFASKGDTPSADALVTLRSCEDAAVLNSWLQRAYRDETSAQILKNGTL